MAKYGISNFTWDTNWQERYVTNPKQMEGTWIGDAIDKGSRPMTPEQLQQELQYAPHLGSCPNTNDMMANAQNHLFKTFTNSWDQKAQHPVATRTPYLSTTVTYPQNAKEFQETPNCQRFEQKPIIETPLPTRPEFPIPSFRNPVPIQTLRSPNVGYPNPGSILPVVENPIPIFPIPIAHPVADNPSHTLPIAKPSKENPPQYFRFPTPSPSPGPTPIVNIAFPPGSQIENFFHNDHHFNHAPTFRIPVVEHDATTAQSKQSFFDQLASLFLSPSTSTDDAKISSGEVEAPKNGVSFQNYISDLLKKRSS